MKLHTFFKHEDTEIAAQIKAATQVTMDDAARDKTRAVLSEYIKMRPIRSHVTEAPEPGRVPSFFMRHSIPAFALVCVVVVGGATAGAAEGSLPGDLLYPIKVHVNEELQGSIAFSPKAKADWAVDRAERRLEEAVTLSLSGQLDDVKRAEIDTNLDEHLKSAGENRQSLEAEHKVSEASDVETNIKAIAFARENILDGVRTAPTMAAMVSDVKASATMSMRVENAEAKRSADAHASAESDTVTKGHRIAAKARIIAAKKFLERGNDKLATTTRAQARVHLQAATEAFSTGDKDAAQGEKAKASSNFDTALETATEIETLISVSHDPKDDSGESKPDPGL